MKDTEMLKKYKELLDKKAITQEEFDQKKSELLAGGTISLPEEETNVTSKPAKTTKKKLNKRIIQRAVIALGAIAVLIGGVYGVKAIVKNRQQATRAAALQEEIKPIMDDYGLATYAVKYAGYDYDVYAQGFESLTNGEALSLLEELDGVSIDDPCGDGEIDFGMTDIHPGLDVEYSYWRVSSALAVATDYEAPGIYCNRYGNECVYACEN